MSNLDLWKKSLSPFSDFENLANSFFRNDMPILRSDLKTIAPKCELSETPQKYTLKFEIPGMKKEDIKIDLHDNRLTVSGERKTEKEEKDKNTFYSEMSYGSFMRTYNFPTAVDAEKVDARYENGILELHLLKTGGSKARQISVK